MNFLCNSDCGGQPNFIKQYNGFLNRIRDKKDLKDSSMNVYFTLLGLANFWYYPEALRVDYSDIKQYLSLNIKTWYTALSELADKGYIVYEKGKNDSHKGSVKLILLYQKTEEQRKSEGRAAEEQRNTGGTQAEYRRNTGGNLYKHNNSINDTNGLNGKLSPTEIFNLRRNGSHEEEKQ